MGGKGSTLLLDVVVTLVTEETLLIVVVETMDDTTAEVGEVFIANVVGEVVVTIVVVVEVVTDTEEIMEDDVDVEAALVEAGIVGLEGGELEEVAELLCNILDFVASNADVSYNISVLPLGKLGAAAVLLPIIVPIVVVAAPLPPPPPTTLVTTMLGHTALIPFPSKKSPISVVGSTATP